MADKDKKFIELFGGSVEGKPHSTPEGRIAAGKRRIKSILEKKKGLLGQEISPPPKKFKLRTPMGKKKLSSYNQGGRATHGYGKAYLKGGRVK